MDPLPRPLALEDSYTTPENATRTLLRLFLPPSAAYYTLMLPIVFIGASKAKRGMYGSREWTESSWHIMRALELAGCRFAIEGMHNITMVDGPAVFIGNHMSTLETFVLPIVIHPVKPITFIVKPSLLDYPVFGHIMRSRNPIVVTRDNPRQDLVTVLREGQERLRDGISIVLFPQTTRTTNFDPSQFNSLGIKLAKNAGVPVIPIAIKSDAWGNGNTIKEFGRIDPERRVHIAFDEPLTVEGGGKEQQDRIVAFIMGKLRDWGVPASGPNA